MEDVVLKQRYNRVNVFFSPYMFMSGKIRYNIKSSAGQMRTRVQAFVESIELKKLQGGAK